jgi:polyferredoxin
MVVLTIVFYGVFSVMREQVCIAICPYGRLQGVLLDKNSIAVIYDWVRGEPRGKMQKKKKAPPKKKEHECKTTCVNCKSGGSCTDDILDKIEKNVAAAAQNVQKETVIEAGLIFPEIVDEKIDKLGDCIECTLCVQVCPTGIDIRNGTQLECINCTACMDACDEVMIKIGREPGLIRYDSHNGVAEKKRKLLTPRVIAYSVVLLAMLIVNTALLTTRSEVDVLLMRTPGMLYQQNEDGTISNLYNYQIINKTNKDLPIEFKLVNTVTGGIIRMVGKSPTAKAHEQTKGALFIDLDKEFAMKNRKNIQVEIWSEGKMITKTKTGFFGPK